MAILENLFMLDFMEHDEAFNKAAGMYGKCLKCGKTGTDAEPTKRGLCKEHYMEFYNQSRKVAEDKYPDYESRLIAAGKLLPARYSPRSSDSDFAPTLEEMGLSKEHQEIAARAIALADKLNKSVPAKPKRKGKE
jgi:hypothetical protein